MKDLLEMRPHLILGLSADRSSLTSHVCDDRFKLTNPAVVQGMEF